MFKKELVKLLTEYCGLARNCQNHHCRKEHEIGFNVKVGGYPDEEVVMEKYKMLYAHVPELIETIDNINVYAWQVEYQEDSWRFAREYFVDSCAIDGPGYILKNYKKGWWPLIKTKNEALKIERYNAQMRSAFEDIRDMWSAGRSGGYVVFDYQFNFSPSEAEDALYMLNEEGRSVKVVLDYYGVTVADIKREKRDLETIREEVIKFVEGHKKGWPYFVEDRILEMLPEYLPRGRKPLTVLFNTLTNCLNDVLASCPQDENILPIKESLSASVNKLLSLLQSDYAYSPDCKVSQ